MTPLEILKQIGHTIATQDNSHCTADPIFLVEQRRRDYGYNTDYSDEIVYVDSESCEISEEEYEALNPRERKNYIATAYVDRWITVQSFFTKNAAEYFIKTNAHRMTDPRLYVDSLYRNKEMIAIRNALIELANEK